MKALTVQESECQFKSPEQTLKDSHENARRGREMGNRDRRTTALGLVSVRDCIRTISQRATGHGPGIFH